MDRPLDASMAHRPAGMRVTRDGLVYVALASALTAVAMISGNNLLFLVVAPLWSLWFLQWPLGRLNLRGVAVRRTLPAELYADQDAPGRWLLLNRRRFGVARSLVVEELGGSAVAMVPRVGAKSSRPVSAVWRFPSRGAVELSGVRVRSSWPFGLVTHEVVIALPAQLLVYPRPLPGRAGARPRARVGLAEEPRPGGAGDFLGLRDYRAGDPPRRIHWPATARLGRAVVVERAHEREHAVEVVIRRRRGREWERELSRACGEIQRATSRGEAVGLRIPGTTSSEPVRLAPALGASWRRRLLDALALAPESP